MRGVGAFRLDAKGDRLRASVRFVSLGPALTGAGAALALFATLASPTPAAAPQPLAPAATTYGADVFQTSSGWERVSLRDGRFRDRSVRSFRPGARAWVDFSGTAFRLYGVVGRGGGFGLVSIDGHPAYVMTFDGPQKLTHRVVYASPTLASGTHRVTVENLREPASPSRYVNLDGIDIR